MDAFHERRKKGTLKGFEAILDIPWGVFCEGHVDVDKANQLLGQNFENVNYETQRITEQIARYSLLLKTDPRVRLPSLLYYKIEAIFDLKMMELVKRLLGRPVETIRFEESPSPEDILGTEDSLGCVMEAVKRTKCSNPVIMLDSVGGITNVEAKRIVDRLLQHKMSHHFVDRSSSVPFDLSNILFIEISDIYAEISSKEFWRAGLVIPTDMKIKLVRELILPSILSEFGLEDRKYLFDREVLKYVFEELNIKRGFEDAKAMLRWIASLLRNCEVATRSEVFKLLESRERNPWDRRPPHIQASASEFLPVGGATLLGASVTEKGSVDFMISSFCEDYHIVNNSEKKQESVDIAYRYLRVNVEKYGIPLDVLERKFTVEYPEGDGRSVGCATFLSLFSLFTNRRVRTDSAVSGVISLSGQIHPIVGVYQKTYAAYKLGIRRIVFPSDSILRVERDVGEKLKVKMTFVFIKTIDELIEEMLEKSIVSDEARAKQGEDAQNRPIRMWQWQRELRTVV